MEAFYCTMIEQVHINRNLVIKKYLTVIGFEPITLQLKPSCRDLQVSDGSRSPIGSHLSTGTYQSRMYQL